MALVPVQRITTVAQRKDPAALHKRTTMNTLMHSLIITGAVIALNTTSTAAAAQDRAATDPQPAAQERKEQRSDRVKSDLSTPATAKDKDQYLRTATREDDGSYAVSITDEEGRLRMTGRFLDETLLVADGTFTYYYPNGNVESTGQFVNGWKQGAWSRYAEDGSPKAERLYAGREWLESAVAESR
jgi:hypothetical protein